MRRVKLDFEYCLIRSNSNLSATIAIHVHSHISPLDAGPQASFEPGHAMTRVKLKWFDRCTARHELEVPHQHCHRHLDEEDDDDDDKHCQCHLQLKESKPHAKASPWALAKSLEGMGRPWGKIAMRIQLRISLMGDHNIDELD